MYWREEGEEQELPLALVKNGYGELQLHHSCRAHFWCYCVSTTLCSGTTAAMETFKQSEE